MKGKEVYLRIGNLTVRARRYQGVLCYHRTLPNYRYDDNQYTVTHAPSAKAIGIAADYHKAKAAIRALLSLDVDWRTIADRPKAGELEAVRATVDELVAGGVLLANAEEAGFEE